MTEIKIPICFFPTTVLFVDDNISFLESLRHLDISNNRPLLFSHPGQLLNYVKLNSTEFLKETIIPCEELDYETYYLQIKLRDLYKQIYNPLRFQEISCIIADYDMPHMTGLELLKKLKDIPAQKILLTGEADENIAVEAFNEGIIHLYIPKKTPSLKEALQRTIYEQSTLYFLKRSRLFYETLKGKNVLTYLTDRSFQEYFSRYRREKNILEYYLVESSGIFLTINKERNISFTFLHEDALIDSLLETEEALSAPPHVLRNLAERKNNLCFFSEENIHFPKGQEWENFCYPLIPLPPLSKNLYVSHTNHPYDVNTSKIVFFENAPQ